MEREPASCPYTLYIGHGHGFRFATCLPGRSKSAYRSEADSKRMSLGWPF